jgi:hypothetical protein
MQLREGSGIIYTSADQCSNTCMLKTTTFGTPVTSSWVINCIISVLKTEAEVSEMLEL